MNNITNRYSSIEQMTDQYLPKQETKEQSLQISFDKILKQKAESAQELKFSKHAAMRLNDRNISLSEEQNERLESGVKRAKEKGIQESLVMVDSLAFIVNVPNKTVVTAMDQGESDEHVFTNIDGAVIA